MNKYIAQFWVYLENGETQISFFRALTAENDNELRQKAQLLKITFADKYNEEWELYEFWRIPKGTQISQMSDFQLTDRLIEWGT